MYLLDTNVVSELRLPQPHKGVVAWLLAHQYSGLFISALTAGEIQTGIETSRGLVNNERRKRGCRPGGVSQGGGPPRCSSGLRPSSTTFNRLSCENKFSRLGSIGCSWANGARPTTTRDAAWVVPQPLRIVHQPPRQQDPTKAEEFESWLDRLIRTQSFLALDAETYRIWAKTVVGQSDTIYEDALIAACAKRHGLTVVTRNVKHFRLFDVPAVNPFDYS